MLETLKVVLSSRISLILAVLLVAAGASPCLANQQEVQLFYTDDATAAGVPGSIVAADLTGTNPATGFGSLSSVRGLAVDSAGTTGYVIAFDASTAWTVFEVDLVANIVVGPVVDNLAIPNGMEISSDDRRLYLAEYGIGLAIVDIAAGTVDRPTVDPIGTTFGSVGVSVSPDEETAVLVEAGQLHVVDLTASPNPVITRTVTAGIAGATDVAISRYGHAAYVVQTGGMLRVDLTTGATTVVGSAGNPPLTSPTSIVLSANGRFAYVTDQGSTAPLVAPSIVQVDLQFQVGGPIAAALPAMAIPSGVALGPPAIPTLHLPFDFSAGPCDRLQIPVMASNLTGQSVTEIDFIMQFSPALLTFLGAEAGDLNAPCTFQFINLPADEVGVLTTCTTPMEGAGSVALLNFQVNPLLAPPPPATFIPLTFSSGNVDQAPACLFDAGLFLADTGTPNGTITYYSTGEPVPDVSLDVREISGPYQDTTDTDADGYYSFTGVPAPIDVELEPRRTGSILSAVSILDALGAAQASVLLLPLSPNQFTAADVTGNGFVTIIDALRIARVAAGLEPNFQPGAFGNGVATPASDWAFNPVSGLTPGASAVTEVPPGANPTYPHGAITYTPLDSHATCQDFEAILYGDVNGSWIAPLMMGGAPSPKDDGPGSWEDEEPVADHGPAPAMSSSGESAGKDGSATLSLPSLSGSPSALYQVPITVSSLSGAGGVDLVLEYNPNLLSVVSVERTAFTATSELVVNLTVPGTIRAGVYDTQFLSGAGDLVQVEFQALGQAGETPLDLPVGWIDEGAVTSTILGGSLCLEGPPPGGPGKLQVGHEDGGSAALSWSPHPYSSDYRVYRAADAGLDDLACLGQVESATSASDDAVPPPGGAFYYLVTTTNCNGESTLGSRSDGGARPAPPACS